MTRVLKNGSHLTVRLPVREAEFIFRPSAPSLFNSSGEMPDSRMQTFWKLPRVFNYLWAKGAVEQNCVHLSSVCAPFPIFPLSPAISSQDLVRHCDLNGQNGIVEGDGHDARLETEIHNTPPASSPARDTIMCDLKTYMIRISNICAAVFIKHRGLEMASAVWTVLLFIKKVKMNAFVVCSHLFSRQREQNQTSGSAGSANIWLDLFMWSLALSSAPWRTTCMHGCLYL